MKQPRRTYVRQCLRSHKGKGPYRVQVVAIRGDRAVLRWLSHRHRRDFELSLRMLAHPTCGWAPDISKPKQKPKFRCCLDGTGGGVFPDDIPGDLPDECRLCVEYVRAKGPDPGRGGAPSPSRTGGV